MKTFHLLLSDGQIQECIAHSMEETPDRFGDLDVLAVGNSMEVMEAVKDALLSTESYSTDLEHGLQIVG